MLGMDKTVKMNVTVPKSLVQDVKAEATREGRNLSNMVTVILRDAMKARKEKAA